MFYEDLVLVCQDCGGRFLFSKDEQKSYARKNLKHIPKRCPACRKRRKWEKLNSQWTVVICEACGAETKVPFKPRGLRPVYCYDCFKKMQAPSQ
ncbi:MAG: CxxC-x17-CxxC domain-containing protein [Anaerolineae bacterium]|nr:CxxC-x17-CxxC domain-containing protein [Anaerolineae bacterium]